MNAYIGEKEGEDNDRDSSESGKAILYLAAFMAKSNLDDYALTMVKVPP